MRVEKEMLNKSNYRQMSSVHLPTSEFFPKYIRYLKYTPYKRFFIVVGVFFAHKYVLLGMIISYL